MGFSVHITKAAERDILGAADYIEYTLKNRKAADDLLNLFEKKISQLVDFPLAHPIIDDPVLKTWQIRFVMIDRYIAFYIVSEETVYILRFLHETRNWLYILKKESDIR